MATITESDISCPITYDIMTDPVQAADGQTYERAAITAWINQHGKSPMNPNMRLTVAGLTTNFAMKRLIDSYHAGAAGGGAAGGGGGGSSGGAVPAFVNATLDLEAFVEPGPANSFMLHAKVNPPVKGDRKPVTLIIGVDVSGSMDTLACDVTETGGKAFTVLDLIKHTMRVMIGMFNEHDTFAIVKYSDLATIVLKPTMMNDEGKRKAEQAIAALKTEGSTNIYDCLRVMNMIANKPEFAGRNVMTTLLTDGVANISPPRGELKTYEMLGRKEMLSTFGFGYGMNSKFLSELAILGGGSFAFIPDYSMVGTVFINFIASLLSTASLNRVMSIKYADGSITNHNTGLIQYGQSRDFVMMLDKQPVEVSIEEKTVAPVAAALSEIAHVRHGLLNKLQHCIAHEGAADFAAFYAKYAASTNENVIAIMKDLKPAGGDDEGQIAMSPRFWQKWGKHYVRSYYNAQLNQFCLNFKDPGLQIYGGELFHQMQDVGDKIFAALPALEPTGNGATAAHAYGATRGHGIAAAPAAAGGGGAVPRAAPMQMAQVFYNTGGGCWSPDSKVRMADNSFMVIQDIRAGMYVWTLYGPALVEYALVLGTFMPTQVMCKMSNLLITPWHPVFINDKWMRPADIANIEEMVMPTVYNMILDKNHIIEVDGVLSCTLGHGIKGDVIEHDYFGNKELILRDLKNQPGFDEKRPVFKNLKVTKSDVTGDIIGWYDDV
jgi:hypothetical protein